MESADLVLCVQMQGNEMFGVIQLKRFNEFFYVFRASDGLRLATGLLDQS